MTSYFEQQSTYDEDPLVGDVDRWVHADETKSDTERDFDTRYAVDPYDDYEDGDDVACVDGELLHGEAGDDGFYLPYEYFTKEDRNGAAAGRLVRSVLDFGRYDESGEEYKKMLKPQS